MARHTEPIGGQGKFLPPSTATSASLDNWRSRWSSPLSEVQQTFDMKAARKAAARKRRAEVAARTQLPPMLPLEDVSALLTVSIKTVRRWVEARELRVHKLGRQIRISVDDLDTFVKQRRE